MAAYEVRDVLMLRRGDRIVVQPGRIETVVRCSKRVGKDGVRIFTDKSSIETTLPCTVKVLGGR